MAAALAVPVECGSSCMSVVSWLSDRLSAVSDAVRAEIVMAVPCLGAWAVAVPGPAGAGPFITDRSRAGTIGGQGTSGGGTAAQKRLRREPSRTARPTTETG